MLRVNLHGPSLFHLPGWRILLSWWPGVLGLLVWSLAVPQSALATTDTVAIIRELITPERLATLRSRGANPRVQKCVYWLAVARNSGADITNQLNAAIISAGYTNADAVRLTSEALLRNLDIAGKLGCLDAEGLSEMRQGKSPTVRRGPYAGDQLSVDHIIPRAVCPELDNVIANLELMPMRLNAAKRDSIGERQIALAREFHRAGLVGKAGLEKVRASLKSSRSPNPA